MVVLYSDCNIIGGDHAPVGTLKSILHCDPELPEVKSTADRHLGEEQAGFRDVQSCNEQIFTLRNILEQCTFQRQSPTSTSERPSTVWTIRASIWKVLKHGIPSKLHVEPG